MNYHQTELDTCDYCGGYDGCLVGCKCPKCNKENVMDLEDLKRRINLTIDVWYKNNSQRRTNNASNTSVGVVGDQLEAAKTDIEQFAPDEAETEEDRAKREAREKLREGKRVVRTSVGGDRVYFLDEDKMTRQWATNPDVLDSLGFGLEDVTNVEEEELLKYQMAPPLHSRADG